MEFIITILLVNNILLFQFLGVDILVNRKAKEHSPSLLVFVALLLMAFCSVLNYVTYFGVLKPHSMEYLTIFAFALNVVLSAVVVRFLCEKLFGFIYDNFSEVISFVSYHSLVFGIGFINIQEATCFSSYLGLNLSEVLAFGLIAWIVTGIGKHLSYNQFPKYVHPLPLLFLVLGLLAMAFKGFANAFY
ncbi:MAG: hypothetical protein PHE89_04680 [Alphaproteobacteria bacterium]|nr:hypothetical protein [Alphaproteobacteria bacterium]